MNEQLPEWQEGPIYSWVFSLKHLPLIESTSRTAYGSSQQKMMMVQFALKGTENLTFAMYCFLIKSEMGVKLIMRDLLKYKNTYSLRLNSVFI